MCVQYCGGSLSTVEGVQYVGDILSTSRACTANASKRTEKYFLDLRNLFSNQENTGTFFSKQQK